MKKLYKMENNVQKYEWGTSDFIANLLGITKDDEIPWAELWMSAHEKAPSFLPEIQLSLNRAITNNPNEFLGKSIAEEYDNKLPYLFKILSAEKPLSIQAHPNLEQAKRGYERENKEGIDLTNFIRNYKDDNHKPELICALTEFHAMCGFRPATEIIDYFTQINLKNSLSEFSDFEKNPSPENWKQVLREILKADVEKKLHILNILTGNLHILNDQYIRGWLSKLLIQYPNDIGVLSPLFLNTFILKPGEAIFLKAGILHAYLKGTGIEIMANSDNVLRGGLTPKNIDVKELVSILNWEMEKPKIQSYDSNQEVTTYQIPIKEFSLKRVNLSGELALDNNEPTMIIVIDGNLVVCSENESMSISQGDSIFIVSDAKKVNLSGDALLFIASTNR